MGRVRASQGLRLGVLCGTFAAVLVVKGVQNGWSERQPKVLGLSRALESENLITGENCTTDYPEFCAEGDCTTLEDQRFACCKPNPVNIECATFHGEVCDVEDLCAAELIPGGNGAAECLATWEPGAGGTIVYVLVLLFLFLGLAIVCDDYFVSSLEKISTGLGLSNDVAGATFMAAGSSAPELFVSLADNVIANPPKSLGIGTIVGSAIFNILVIIGLSALLAGQRLYLDWRPLARDITFYCISIIALALVVLDGEVQSYEAAVLLLLYVSYIVFMKFNQKFFLWLDTKLGIDRTENAQEKQVEENSSDSVSTDDKVVIEEEEHAPSGTAEEDDTFKTIVSQLEALAEAAAEPRKSVKRNSVRFDDSVDADEQGNPLHKSVNRVSWRGLRAGSVRLNGAAVSTALAGVINEDDDEEKASVATERKQSVTAPLEIADGDDVEGGYWASLCWPKAESGACCGDMGDLAKARFWFLATFPYAVLFRFTIPDCTFDVFNEDKEGKPENRKKAYWSCFTMCVVWIAFLSHMLVYSATKFGCVVGISPTVMGLTIVAAGTSVPDAISSIIVARQGQGDMAIANSIGSNVFDILLGLGLPWLLATAFVYKVPTVVQVGDLTVSLAFLFGVVFALLGILKFSKWSMGSRVGILLICLYAFYVVFELFIHPNI